MSFFVTPSFTVVDTDNSFSSLSPEEKIDLLYNARDVWEANNGQWTGQRPLPKVVTGNIDPEETYGTIEP
jgi:hypothetical protein